jgi:hypothetical protein
MGAQSSGCRKETPGVVATPGASGDSSAAVQDLYCGTNGRLAGIDQSGSCPKAFDYDAPADIIVASRAEDGSVPECPADDMYTVGWQVRVASVSSQEDAEHPGYFFSIIKATRTDGNLPCPLALSVRLKGQVLRVSKGAQLLCSVRLSVGNFEGGGSRIVTVRDANGQLIVAGVEGRRPEPWDSQVLPEVKVAPSAQVLCTSSSPGFKPSYLLSALLGSETGQCSVDANTRGCCVFGGRKYVVTNWLAYRSTPEPNEDATNLAVVLVAYDFVQPGR